MNNTGIVTKDGEAYLPINGKQPDVLILTGGQHAGIYRVRPLSENGEHWLRANSPADNWCGNTLVVPEKLVSKLALAMHYAGLVLGGES